MTATANQLAQKLAPGFPGKHVAGIENVSQEVSLGLRYMVADVTVRYTRRRNDQDRHYEAVQTVAQYDSPNHRFPTFSLQPSNKMLDMVARMSGYADVDFPSHPAFSSAYLLTGTSPPAIRRLFEHAPLLDLLGRRTGLTIHSELSGLVIHRWELRCDDAQRKAFAAEATVLFKLFEDAAAAAQHKPAPKMDPEAYFASLPGPQGRQLRKRAVLRAHLAAFLAQPVPRAPGWNLFSAAAGVHTFFFLLLGAVFAGVGGGFAALNARSGSIPGVVFPLLFAAGGVAAIGYSLFLAVRARRLLRHGVRAQARIEALEPNGNSTNGEPDFRLRVRFQAGAQAIEADCTVTGPGTLRARTMQAEDKALSILYDPDKPEQFLFVEGLLTLSPEIEP
ncbi:MAG: hypothetical protein ACT4P9_02015 [Betaproteobacteria bacterium]